MLAGVLRRRLPTGTRRRTRPPLLTQLWFTQPDRRGEAAVRQAAARGCPPKQPPGVLLL